MKPAILAFALISVLTIPSRMYAQVADATVCEILASPESFDGKIVRVQGAVVAGFEEFAIRGANCNQSVNAILLSYPQGTGGKAGPVAMVRLQLGRNHPASITAPNRAPVTLAKNNEFKKFDDLLSQQGKARDVCLGCAKFIVTATLVGRIDASKETSFVRDPSGTIVGIGGFGHLNRYSARLVLQSVSDVTSQEIDYGKPGVPADASAFVDRVFTPGSPSADQIKRGADAFGAPGEDNGVAVGFSGANEVPREDTWKSAAVSPDGLVFRTVFDQNRLKGPLLEMAIAHLGTHIADLRGNSTLSTLPLYGAEFRAWQTSVLSGVAEKAKTITTSGSYVVYSQSWRESDMGSNANAAIAGFLVWAAIANPPKP